MKDSSTRSISSSSGTDYSAVKESSSHARLSVVVIVVVFVADEVFRVVVGVGAVVIGGRGGGSHSVVPWLFSQLVQSRQNSAVRLVITLWCMIFGQMSSPENITRLGSYFCRTEESRDRFEP